MSKRQAAFEAFLASPGAFAELPANTQRRARARAAPRPTHPTPKRSPADARRAEIDRIVMQKLPRDVVDALNRTGRDRDALLERFAAHLRKQTTTIDVSIGALAAAEETIETQAERIADLERRVAVLEGGAAARVTRSRKA